jgi:hypothetical protein
MLNNKYIGSGNTIERNQTLYKTLKVDSLNIFFGETEPRCVNNSLLHLFPASAARVRNLMMPLSNEFHLDRGR